LNCGRRGIDRAAQQRHAAVRRAPGAQRRSRLLVVVLACLVPAVVAAVLVIGQAWRERSAALVEIVLGSARATMARVDSELGAAIAGLQALATAPALAEGDLAAFDAQLRRALPLQAGNKLVPAPAWGWPAIPPRAWTPCSMPPIARCTAPRRAARARSGARGSGRSSRAKVSFACVASIGPGAVRFTLRLREGAPHEDGFESGLERGVGGAGREPRDQ
jgi:hypothetical protein